MLKQDGENALDRWHSACGGGIYNPWMGWVLFDPGWNSYCNGSTVMRIPERLRTFLAARALEIMSSRKPDFQIGPENDRYLKRWFYIPRNLFFNIYIHQILHDDEDRALHDHPAYNLSLVLANGYIEVTPQGTFTRTTGDIVFRGPRWLHRLVVHRTLDGMVKPAFTLWVSGPKFRWSGFKLRRNWWGFACPKGWVHWEDFTDSRDKGAVGKGCGEYQ